MAEDQPHDKPRMSSAARAYDARMNGAGTPFLRRLFGKIRVVVKTAAKILTTDIKDPNAFWRTDLHWGILHEKLEMNSLALLKRDAQIQAIFQAFPDIFFLLDAEGRITEASGTPLGGSGTPWVGKSLGLFPNPEVGQRFASLLAVVRATGQPGTLEYTLLDGGRMLFYEARLMPIGRDQLAVLIRDISDRKTALEALRSSEERYALAAQAANDGLWDWNLPSGRIFYSIRWKNIVGCAETEIGQTPEEWFGRVHPEDAEYVKREIAALGGDGRDLLEIEYRIRHSDGGWRWVLTRGIAVRGDDNAAYRIVGSQTDITPRKIVERQLRHEAFHDKLTGLANRALLMDRLANVLHRTRRQEGYIFAVLYLDLDRFNSINERLGHVTGDRILQTVAERVRKVTRAGDTVARLGDDEFVILLDGITSSHSAVDFADRIQQELSTPWEEGAVDAVTASIGIALGETDVPDGEALLRDAEAAMQRAKRNGKARHEMFDRSNQQALLTRLELEADLQRAIKKNELELYYQPIISLSTGKIIRLEALLRWNHPKRGQVPPMEFIPLAEESGLILTIGDWVLHEVAAQHARWRQAKMPTVGIAVNFSPRQFQQENLLSTFKSYLSKAPISPGDLELEITETAAMKNVDDSVRTLRGLRDLGVRISMDDFGTGYSSLSCLSQFPLDTLKIDRAFVKGLPAAKESTLANAIIALGHSLGISMVAEGIETEEQLAFLRNLNCEEGQGYLFGRPMPAKDVAVFIQKQDGREWGLPKGAAPKTRRPVT